MVCIRRESPLHQRPVLQLHDLQYCRSFDGFPGHCERNPVHRSGTEQRGSYITRTRISLFDPVWKGHYDVTAFKIGYDTYKISNTFISSDKVFNIVLSEKKYPPTCLVVDPVSLKATW